VKKKIRKLGISLTTYERGDTIMHCVKSIAEDILRLEDTEVSIIVTDDCSVNNKPDLYMINGLLEKLGITNLVQGNTINKGVGMNRHNHTKMLLFAEPELDCICFMDDDIEVEAGYFHNLMRELLINEDAGMVGGVSPFTRGEGKWGGNPYYKPDVRSFYTFNPYDNFMVRVEDLKVVGNIDSRLTYWEDMDLLIRMRMRGRKNYMVNEARIKQGWKVSGGLQSGGAEGREMDKLVSAEKVLEKYPDLIGLYWDGSLRLEIPFDEVEKQNVADFRMPEFDSVS